MQITLLDNAQELRAAFVKKFVMDWPEYQIVCKKFVKRWKIKQTLFDRMLMWDKMRREYPTVPFRDALALLRSLSCKVLFMSEGQNYPYDDLCILRLSGKEYPHFVAMAEAQELAALIEYEWFEDARLNEQMCQLENPVLPQDLYICTPGMEHMLVFTHETPYGYDDDLVAAAEGRLCIAFGFDIQK